MKFSSFKRLIKKLCLLDLYNWKLIINEIKPKILVTLRIFKVLILKLMENFQVFQTIYHTNFCISTDIKTTANFLTIDIEMASFIARHCTYSSCITLLFQTLRGSAFTTDYNHSNICGVLNYFHRRRFRKRRNYLCYPEK